MEWNRRDSELGLLPLPLAAFPARGEECTKYAALAASGTNEHALVLFQQVWSRTSVRAAKL